jgi:transposase-like protein
MKPTLKSPANGFTYTYIAPLINSAPQLISWFPSTVTAATAFFKQAIDANGFSSKVVINKSGANNAGIENINMLLMLAGLICFIEIFQVKYLNNLIEQDHQADDGV